MSRPVLHAVLPRPPHPTRDGSAIRNYHLLAALSRQFTVRAFVLLPPHLAGETPADPEGVSVERIPQSRRSLRRAAAVAAGVFGAAYAPRLYRSRRLAESLRAAASRDRPRWVLACGYHVAPLALSASRPVWLDLPNVDSEIWRRIGETAASPLARAFARKQAPRVAGVERGLARRASGISCVSAREADLVSRMSPSSEPILVPNGVDLARYAYRETAPPGEVLFFVGDLSWPPNAEGLRWMLREVWPRIRRLRPGARVEILGRHPPAGLVRESGADVHFLGEGGDTRPHWRRAAVAVVPLLAGGGTRLKILEAAACGVPVVSTSLGAEGLALEPEREILLRDEPEGFAAAVAALVSQPERAKRQTRAARERVEALYGWNAIGQRFTAELARRSSGPV